MELKPIFIKSVKFSVIITVLLFCISMYFGYIDMAQGLGYSFEVISTTLLGAGVASVMFGFVPSLIVSFFLMFIYYWFKDTKKSNVKNEVVVI